MRYVEYYVPIDKMSKGELRAAVERWQARAYAAEGKLREGEEAERLAALPDFVRALSCSHCLHEMDLINPYSYDGSLSCGTSPKTDHLRWSCPACGHIALTKTAEASGVVS